MFQGDDPKVLEAKIQVNVNFTWVLSLVASGYNCCMGTQGDVTPLLEAKILKERDFAWVQQGDVTPNRGVCAREQHHSSSTPLSKKSLAPFGLPLGKL